MFRNATILLLVAGLTTGCQQDTAPPDDATTQQNVSDGSARNSTDTSGSAAHGDLPTEDVTEAVCQLEAIADSGVTGTITFTREDSTVRVHGEIHGLTPGQHGFHIHEHGDLSDKETGKSAGGHFNPTGKPHGRPNDEARHVGDLGNIEADDNGKAVIDMEDSVIELNGLHSIVGRALVVHAQADQFTQPAGEAGDRVAFGLIEAVTD